MSWTRRGPVHTDVALWYLLDADSEQIVSYDDAEFTAVRWWLSFDARDREGSARVFDAAVGAARARPRTEYYLAVVPADDERVGGFVRLALGGVKAGKLGYAIHADHWGRGCATDAAAALIGFGFTTLGLHRITAAVGPDNQGRPGALDDQLAARHATRRRFPPGRRPRQGMSQICKSPGRARSLSPLVSFSPELAALVALGSGRPARSRWTRSSGSTCRRLWQQSG